MQWPIISWFISKYAWSFIFLPQTSIFYNSRSALVIFNTKCPGRSTTAASFVGPSLSLLSTHTSLHGRTVVLIVELVNAAALKLILRPSFLQPPQSLSSFLWSKYTYPLELLSINLFSYFLFSQSQRSLCSN